MSKKLVSLDELSRYDGKIKKYVDSKSILKVKFNSINEFKYDGNVTDDEDLATFQSLAESVLSDLGDIHEDGLISKDISIELTSLNTNSFYGTITVDYSNGEINSADIVSNSGPITFEVSYNVTENEFTYNLYETFVDIFFGSFDGVSGYTENNTYIIGDYVYTADRQILKCINSIPEPKEYDSNDWESLSIEQFLRDKLNIPSTGVNESNSSDIDNMFNSEEVSE